MGRAPAAATRSPSPCWRPTPPTLTGVYTLEAAEIDSIGNVGTMSGPVMVNVTSDQLVTFGDFGGATAVTNDLSNYLYYYLPCDEDACNASIQTGGSSTVPADPTSLSSTTPGYWFPTNTCSGGNPAGGGAGTVELHSVSNTGLVPAGFPAYDDESTL